MQKYLSFLSLRARLLILIFITIFPALALLFYTAFQQKDNNEADIRAETLHIAKIAALHIEQLAQDSRQMLSIFADNPSVRNYDEAGCRKYVSELHKHLPVYWNMVALKPDGDYLCSAQYTEKKVNVADRSWFQRTIRTRSFTFGDYIIGRILDRPTICAALPVMDQNGNVRAVVAAAFNLESFNKELSRIDIPKGSSITVIDREGTVIARYPNPEKWVGVNVSETLLVRKIFRQKEGTAEVVGLEGKKRIFSFTPVNGSGEGLYVAFGISPDVAYATVRRTLKKGLFLMLIMVCLTIAAAWFGTDYIIMRRVNRLIKATNELAEGNLGARVEIAGDKDEIDRLAESFNNMAASLESDIAERKKALETMDRLRMQNEQILNSAGEGIFGIDTSGNCTFVNPATAIMLGYTIEELVGKNGHNMFHHSRPDGSFYPEEECPIYAAYRDGLVYGEENEVYWRKDGTNFPVRYISTPIIENGKIKGAVVSFRDITERKRAEEQLRNLYANLQSMREEERAAIAREIHDELGQILTAIKMDIAWMNKKYSDHEGVSQKTAATLDLIDKTIKTVKKICTELRPEILDHLGLGAAIQWQAAEFQGRTGIQCEVSLDEDIEMEMNRTTALFRIFQEALTNIMRHANATKVTIDLSEKDGNVILEVTDNGKGISEEEMSKPSSFGLLGMRERVYPWKGSVNITGSPGKGTTVRVSIQSA